MIDLLKKKEAAVSHGDNRDLSVHVASDIDMELGVKMLMKRLKDLQRTSSR